MSLTMVETLLTPQMRLDLAALAEGVLPLQHWIETKYYNPKNDPTFHGQPMPWREAGKTLTPAETGFELFFEGLLRETSGDVQAKVRWERVAANPLVHCPHADATEWRAERGLDEYPSFGIVQAQNVLLDSQNHQVSRISFYRETLPDLTFCLKSERPSDSSGWESLAIALFKNQLSTWPGLVYPSSVFITQFTADVLYAVLGMRNLSAVRDEPAYATAVLTELGQARRRGNKNTPEQAARAVERFLAQVKRDLHGACETDRGES